LQADLSISVWNYFVILSLVSATKYLKEGRGKKYNASFRFLEIPSDDRFDTGFPEHGIAFVQIRLSRMLFEEVGWTIAVKDVRSWNPCGMVREELR
jgi:hypothetical protein